MNPSGDYNHQQGADYGSGHYRPELGGDDIDVYKRQFRKLLMEAIMLVGLAL